MIILQSTIAPGVYDYLKPQKQWIYFVILGVAVEFIAILFPGRIWQEVFVF